MKSRTVSCRQPIVAEPDRSSSTWTHAPFTLSDVECAALYDSVRNSAWHRSRANEDIPRFIFTCLLHLLFDLRSFFIFPLLSFGLTTWASWVTERERKGKSEHLSDFLALIFFFMLHLCVTYCFIYSLVLFFFFTIQNSVDFPLFLTFFFWVYFLSLLSVCSASSFLFLLSPPLL